MNTVHRTRHLRCALTAGLISVTFFLLLWASWFANTTSLRTAMERQPAAGKSESSKQQTSNCQFASSTFPDAVCNEHTIENLQLYRTLVHHFETKGANASVDVSVVDDSEQVVPLANVTVSFTRPGGNGKYSTVRKITDETGHCFAEGISCWDVAFRVEKEGFYSYSSNLVLRPFMSVRGMESGLWFQNPYPVLCRIVKKGHPHLMCFRDVEIRMPSPGESIGFDLVEGLPTPPHGSGHHVDVTFMQESDSAQWTNRSLRNRESTFRITFPDQGAGGVVVGPNETSELKSPRLAPYSGYKHSLSSILRIVDGKITEGDKIPSNHYILFRIRNEPEVAPTETRWLYGKMRGDWFVNGQKRLLWFRTWLNDVRGERNLEDTSGWQ